MRQALAVLVSAIAVVAASAAPARAATNECRGLQTCIRVPGPWVLVPAGGTSQFLLSCPRGRAVVGGLDARATSRAVRVGFDGRVGAPVSPGVTTTTYALFRALWANEDDAGYTTAMAVLDGRHTWIEEGVGDPSGAGPMMGSGG